MASYLDYAALSAVVYNGIKGQDNILATPLGWSELLIYPNGITSTFTGFNARAYSNGTEIVIAYEGTDTDNTWKTVQDFMLGNTAGAGFSPQLIQAALFYEQVKAQYGSNVTFTGHSLGGGLASVMGVWFGKSTTTFAPAPFGLAAVNPIAIAAVQVALSLNLYSDSDFLLFNPQSYSTRQANITSYTVPGEVLIKYLSALPTTVGTQNLITIGGASLLPGSDFGNAVTLHSMILHASLLMSQTFDTDTVLLPKLLTEIFDGGLYGRDPTTPNRDFLSTLLNDQIRVGYTNADGLLSRFAGDIDKLTQYDTNLKDGALGKALIDVAIADYYFMQSGFTKEFFKAISGGLSFDLTDIKAPNGWASNKTARQLDDAIISQYLNGDQASRLFLAQDNYWSIQSGSTALNATGTGSNNDAMIGGTTGDTLDGGAGNDFLYGGDGADTLTGGEGNDQMTGGKGDDTMDGGAGYDTYLIEGSDTIQDADGQGTLRDKAGNLITGAIEKREDGSYVYLSDPSISVTKDADLTLTLADGTVAIIKNYQDGDLGLQLVDKPADPQTTLTINGDVNPADTDPDKTGIQAKGDAQGNPIGTAEPYEDILLGSDGNDHILSGELTDLVGAGAGDDWIEGGNGNDYLIGGSGNDLIEGGTGSDILLGREGNDRLYADTKVDTATAIDNGNNGTGSGQKGDWLTGNAGDDTLITGADNDVLAGGAGADLLIAGAGDDNILGDADYSAVYIMPGGTPRYSVGNIDWYRVSPDTFNWTVTPGPDATEFAPVVGETDPAGGGADAIYAGAGDDHVWAGEGDDTVYGEAGADSISGDAGSDVLLGGAGDDKIWGDSGDIDESLHGDDFIDGGDGNDELYGMGGNDTLYGGAGDDKLYGDQSDQVTVGNNYLNGEDGNDTLWGGKGDDILLGGAGDDTLLGGDGTDTLEGGEGKDTLQTTGGNSDLDGGAGDDDLSAYNGGNYLDGGDSKDTLWADGGNNTLFGGAGDDSLSAGGGNNYLDGEEGNNTVIADGGNNTLFAGAGDDTLSSGGGGSYLDGGDGTNLLIADGGNNTLFGGTGNDTLSSSGGNSYLDGGDGNDTLIADGGNNTLNGGAGDDTLSAGGGGNTMDGGEGNDTYRFDIGFGEDHIVDADFGNTAQFNFSFDGSGIIVGLGSLKLSFASGDVLHIDGFDPEDPLNTCSITTFKFNDRTLSLQDVLDLGGTEVDYTLGQTITGTPDADTLQGTGLRDHIYGLAGNDTIDAGAGNDTIEGGDGNDTIDGGTGADVMKGGYGDDTYTVDNAGDQVIEDVGQRFTYMAGDQLIDFTVPDYDTVNASVTYTLGNNLENLNLTGTDNINGTGNTLDNYMVGNDGNNVLSGGAGDDWLNGGAGDDTLSGGTGADVLDGGAGADAMVGGAGNDVYLVDDSGDVVTESLNEGTDTVQSTVTYTLGANIENLNLGGTDSIDGTGNALANVLSGNSASNRLDGGAGNDTLNGYAGADAMAGGAGNDTYFVDDAGDVIVENLNEGMDIVGSTASYTLSDNVENLSLFGQGSIGTGNAQDNIIIGYNDNRNDSINYVLSGGAGNDTLTGNIGDDTLDGGNGADVMNGGLGGDTYVVDNTGDQVIESLVGQSYSGSQWVWTGWGYQLQPYTYTVPDIDTVDASITYTLGNNLENLNLTGAGNINGTGNALDNTINGNDGNNILLGGAGNDILSGGAGADVMGGGIGHDTYYVDNAGDQVIETIAGQFYNYGWGSYFSPDYEQVYSSVTFTLGNNLEYLTLTGSDIINGTGNELDNVIYGNDGANTLMGNAGYDYMNGGGGNDTLYGGDGGDTLDGGAGADVMDGGAGDDTYVVDNVGDTAVEASPDGGWDSVSASADFTLGANIERLQLIGDAISGTGNELDNQIQGNDMDNTLSGLDGNDILDGGAGNDTIAGGEGDDSIYGGSDSWENRALDNSDILDGGAGDDYIDGGSGNDLIFGGSGNDNLYGGYDGGEGGSFLTNDDTIYGGDGNDTIDGQAGDDLLFGDAGDDVVYGGDGNDIIDGGAGLDALVGGQGDDVYVVEGAYVKMTDVPTVSDCGHTVLKEQLVWTTDAVIESGGEGYDVVFSSASYTLPDNVEELRLTFAPALAASDPQQYADLLAFGQNGFGNALDNVIVGNALANRLEGGAGDDTLEGGAGNDTLVGDAGNDTLMGGEGDDRYVFRLGDGADTIVDNQGSDTLRIGSGLTLADMQVVNDNGNAVISINGTSDSIVLSNWFGQTEGVSRIKFCDGSVVDRQGIANMTNSPIPNKPLSNQTTREDNAYSFAIPADTFSYASAGNGDPLSYSATMADGGPLPSWLDFDAATGIFSGTPDNWDVSTLSLKVKATNASGHAASSNFTLDVLNVNDAPTVVDPLPDQSITEGQAFSYTLPGKGTSDGFLNDAMDTGTADRVWPAYKNGLYGSGVNDTYTFSRGDGNVYIGDWDNSPQDTVQFTDVSPADITVTQDQWGEVIISVNGTTDSLTLGGWLYSDTAKIEQLVFADGAVWGVNEIASMLSTAPGTGNDFITGTDGNDTIRAVAGDDGVLAGMGNDTVIGGAGNDWLVGGGGSDILSSGSGADYIEADWNYSDGSNDLLMGGTGDDYLGASVADDLLIGGQGNDTVSGYDGNNVILFNRGDGNDWIDPWSSGVATQADTVSLGGGIAYADLSFSRDGGNLILDTGNGETVVFDSWFSTNWSDSSFHGNEAVNRLQIVAEAMLAYAPNSADPLLNKRIQQFDFVGLANQFEAALMANPSITTWQLAPHLADFSLGGSDTAAIGGDMAYLYGKNGDLDRLTEAEVRTQLNDATFGTGSQTLTKATPMAGTGVFNDVDFIHGDRLTFSATLVDGSPLPAWLVFDAASGTFSGTPDHAAVGNLNVSVIATDTGGLSATTNFVLNVNGVTGSNMAPTLTNPLSGQTTFEDNAFAFAIPADTFSDADLVHGDTLTYSATLADGNLLPDWLVFDATTGTFSGTPDNWDVGSLNVVVTAMDNGGLSASSEFILDVLNVNDAPTLANMAEGQNAIEGQPFSFAIPAGIFNDDDFIHGDSLTYSATLADGSALPSWLDFDAATQTFSGTPTNSAVANLNMSVIATDTGGLTASTEFVLNVANASDAPVVATPLIDQVTLEDHLFSYTVPGTTFNDVDFIHGDSLTYSATLTDGNALPAWLTFDSATQTFSGTPDNLDVGSMSLTVTATDTGGLTTSSTFELDVLNVNDAPVVVNMAADQNAIENQPFSFAIPAGTFSDDDFIHGDSLTYSATLADGSVLPSWLSFDAATGTFNGTPLNADVGSLNLAVTATDAGGLTASNLFNLSVANVNDGPTAADDMGAAQEDGGAVILSGATLLANDTDPDMGDILNIVGVSQADSGATVSLVPSSSSGQVRDVHYDVGNLYQSLGAGQTATDTFSYTIADAAGATSKADVVMTITGVNDAPETAADMAAVQEDNVLAATGSVLSNDTDVDAGTVLTVTDAGSRSGAYGSLSLAAGGSYIYALDNGAAAVQSLAEGETAFDSFTYLASDGVSATPGVLSVAIAGQNDIPVLANPLSDKQLAKNTDVSWKIPANSFTDIDRNDTLSYSAKLASGSALPSWLKFDTATQTFSGHVPGSAKDSLDILVTASDGHGANSSAADVFSISFGNDGGGKGNEGVGNGQDAPPPGHDYNQNDGPGTSPGNPGSSGGNGHDDHYPSEGNSCDGKSDSEKSWGSQNKSNSFAYVGLKDVDQHRDALGSAMERCGTSANDETDYYRRWVDVDLKVSRMRADSNSQPSWLDPAHGADIGALAHISGGTGNRSGVDPVSLSGGSGTCLKGFRGLQEGMARLG